MKAIIIEMKRDVLPNPNITPTMTTGIKLTTQDLQAISRLGLPLIVPKKDPEARKKTYTVEAIIVIESQRSKGKGFVIWGF
jgi:hypothetical protein